MNIMLIIITVIIITLLAGGIFFIVMRLRGGSKTDFMLIGREGKTLDLFKCKIILDQNTKEKVFNLSKFGKRLPLKPANLFLNGKPIRVVTYDSGGDIVYADPCKLDEKNYMNINLSPEEKQIALNRYKDNASQFGSDISKFQAMVVIGLVVMFIFSALGTSYTAYSISKAVKTVAENSEDAKTIAQSNAKVSETNKEVVEQLAAISTALTNNKNITRQLT